MPSEGEPGTNDPTSEASRRPWPASLGVGLFFGLLSGGCGVAVVALPLYGVAMILEPSQGTGSPFVHDGLTNVALPFGVVVAVVAAVAVTRWWQGGGRLPDWQREPW